MVKHDKPFEGEYAKSGRAGCKGCKTNIAQDSLRLAVMVQSPFFDGKVPKWFHERCFWAKHRPKCIEDIFNATNLRSSDIDLIQKKISECSNLEDEPPSKKRKKAAPKQSKSKTEGEDVNTSTSNTIKTHVHDFEVELAKSNRSTCIGCEAKIAKDDIRVGKKEFESVRAKMLGGLVQWYHLQCFASIRSSLEFYEIGSNLPGYKSLNKENKELVVCALPKLNIKAEPSTSTTSASTEDATISKLIKEQSDKFYKIYDKLKLFSEKSLESLAEENNLHFDNNKMIKEREKILTIADFMVFGKLKTCENCNAYGYFKFIPDKGYRCMNTINNELCNNIEVDPEREIFIIPADIEDEKFFKKYKCKVGKRYIPVEKAAPTTSTASVKPDENSEPKVKRFLPLKDMTFFVHASEARSKKALQSDIIQLGGEVVSKVSPNLTAVIAKKEAVEEANDDDSWSTSTKVMKQIEEFEIQVVPKSFIKKCADPKHPDGFALEEIVKSNLATWGSDVKERLTYHKNTKSERRNLLSISSRNNMTASTGTASSGKVKLKIKDGVAVDPESGMEDTCEVAMKDGKYLNATLNLTDSHSGKNSYYKLQVLKSTVKKSEYYLFRSWGRIGTTIGSEKIEKFKSIEPAYASFIDLYLQKSGNLWGAKDFQIKPGFMVLMDVDYDRPTNSNNENKAIVKTETCDLQPEVIKLIELLFNKKKMNDFLLSYELDVEKMPLGKLSETRIKQGLTVLNEIMNLIEQIKTEDKPRKVDPFVSFSNKFFTLIPHSFGLENPPVLNNSEIVKSKLDLLENLLKINEAYNMMNSESSDNSPVQYYVKLQSDIKLLDKSHENYNIIKTYVENSHAPTHTLYKLKIDHVFEVARHGESKRFKPFEKLGNKMLLWHGSRITNFASIISKGLCIAPPEAPVTGYMFGKGIYFADSVSKSANYCMTTRMENTGLLLLCEVALGKMLPLDKAKYIEKLEKSYHSTHGVGQSAPNPDGHITIENNLTVPLGKLEANKQTTFNKVDLLYNEYVVYDPAQVKVRYILQTTFDYDYDDD